MKEIVDLVLLALICIGLLFPMLYYTIKETEEAREFVNEYYAHLKERNQDIERKQLTPIRRSKHIARH